MTGAKWGRSGELASARHERRTERERVLKATVFMFFLTFFWQI